MTTNPQWEHFDHDADIGIRGLATTLAQAFEQAAMALTAVITDTEQVHPMHSVTIHCQAQDNDILFFDWINELIYQMATRNMLFSRFHVVISNHTLKATIVGEKLDISKHQPAVEIKGATFTELRVYRQADGLWLAQCVIDV